MELWRLDLPVGLSSSSNTIYSELASIRQDCRLARFLQQIRDKVSPLYASNGSIW